MRKARQELLDVNETLYYNCICGCVRRAFLCGEDHLTGKNYEHRKDVGYCGFSRDRGGDWKYSKDIVERVNRVREVRLKSKKKNTCDVLANTPSEYELLSSKEAKRSLAIPRTTSVNREYLAADLLPEEWVVSDNAYFVEEPEAWLMSVVVSRLHLVWVATVCGKMKNDYRYSNTLGWNTFPVPTLTDLYAPDKMPENLRREHERNDEVLERIYIGRRFKK